VDAYFTRAGIFDHYGEKGNLTRELRPGEEEVFDKEGNTVWCLAGLFLDTVPPFFICVFLSLFPMANDRILKLAKPLQVTAENLYSGRISEKVHFEFILGSFWIYGEGKSVKFILLLMIFQYLKQRILMRLPWGGPGVEAGKRCVHDCNIQLTEYALPSLPNR
ncbi:MAG: hypothetical protein ACMUIA_09035, partial [bacterium]